MKYLIIVIEVFMTNKIQYNNLLKNLKFKFNTNYLINKKPILFTQKKPNKIKRKKNLMV